MSFCRTRQQLSVVHSHTQRGAQSKARVICNVHIKYVFRHREVPSQRQGLSVMSTSSVYSYTERYPVKDGLSVMSISSVYSDTEGYPVKGKGYL